MRNVVFLCCLLFFQNVSSQDTKIKFTGEIRFISNAPLEIIKAKSTQFLGIIDTSTQQFAFNVKLKSFKGFNSALQQEHFHENYLESEKYPQISYSGKILDKIPWSVDGTYDIRAKGKFVIHGVTNERIIKSSITILKKKVYLSCNFEVILSEYNIKIPKIIHKKIAEEILVQLSASQE
jgi:hypothetical protein